jgi:hypothetical protein
VLLIFVLKSKKALVASYLWGWIYVANILLIKEQSVFASAKAGSTFGR